MSWPTGWRSVASLLTATLLADWATSAGGPAGPAGRSLTSGSSPGCRWPSATTGRKCGPGPEGVAVALWGSREILPELGVTLPEDITRLMTDHAYGAADEVISGGASAYRIGCWTSVR